MLSTFRIRIDTDESKAPTQQTLRLLIELNLQECWIKTFSVYVRVSLSLVKSKTQKRTCHQSRNRLSFSNISSRIWKRRGNSKCFSVWIKWKRITSIGNYPSGQSHNACKLPIANGRQLFNRKFEYFTRHSKIRPRWGSVLLSATQCNQLGMVITLR